ncbi:TRAP transporter large permease subunit [Campylobacter sp. RM9344]|uniref:TRAP transporter large permease subunit n=1 Tax=Campylobacter californiensis TaxID=1032243 RepID=A0AAW3ZYC4_9BACT|nr:MULTISPECIES: Na+/H+ antiporter NhaC family protein [unclassified Campylobacter]MBE2985002.1 TRAP transporter large permease subunit [Campylobacter sp. RM6883]MBE2986766.1 TRAP transporter large permease subunit [Campylobacter sp. RM12919]MBE2988440.1 TRAP transporter large permease subunit [Campylobacter sp. RM12920]MBE2995198.1 TRAP transporter large permease subunit [Campylobacter sp. RM6913]MBE3029546.1 TRAP transporter large permease subunit [Campylobacter sp. RM9344]
MLTNPVVLSIAVMTILCLLRFNILLSILVSALVAGIMYQDGSFLDALTATTSTLITGMKGNLETSLSYILLGALAAAIANTNLTAILINSISKILSDTRTYFALIIAGVACFSQNLIPVHIAFIPILIPPLLPLMNKLKIDRRAVAAALTFGLKAPYVSLSVGFGLIFHGIIKRELENNGVKVEMSDISGVMWIGGASMLVGLLLAVFVFYRGKREYQNTEATTIEMKEAEFAKSLKMTKKEWAVLGGAVVAFGIQILTSSMPLGALLGLLVMIVFGGIEYKKIDNIMNSGLAMMAFIAFIMLVAAGFGAVLRESGGIEQLVSFASSLAGGKLGGAILMLAIGLLVTMGIGTSFGTIPIIAAIYVPLALNLGFSPTAIILLVGIAAALGDAGSPASDSTLGPTSGLNADGQHNHIYDTCVPTFVFFNIPLMIGGVIGALVL